tara:strand:+ start:996 stop:1280 length:285 start_codon:yes stop_codon:yes gene_type:complete
VLGILGKNIFMKKIIILTSLFINILIIVIGSFMSLEDNEMANQILLLGLAMALIASVVSIIMLLSKHSKPTLFKGWYLILGLVPYYFLLNSDEN